MTWQLGTIDNKNNKFYQDMFVAQHVKHTPKEILQKLAIDNFEAHLTTIWKNTSSMFVVQQNMQLFDYVDSEGMGQIIAYALGVFDDNNKFHIRHFCFTDMTNIMTTHKDIFNEFFELCIKNSKPIDMITIRSNKGVPVYHDLILHLGFNTSECGYFPPGYDPTTHQEYEMIRKN